MSLDFAVVILLTHAVSVRGQGCGLFDNEDRANLLPAGMFYSIMNSNVRCLEDSDGVGQDLSDCRDEYIDGCNEVACIGRRACQSTDINGASRVVCDGNFLFFAFGKSTCQHAKMRNIPKGGVVECLGPSNNICADTRMSGDGDFDALCRGASACAGAIIDAGVGMVNCKDGACVRFNRRPIEITAKCVICGENGCDSSGGCKFTPFSEAGAGATMSCPAGGLAGDCTGIDFCALDINFSTCYLAKELVDLKKKTGDSTVITNDVATLKADSAAIKNDIATLKADSTIIKDEIAALQGNSTEMKISIAALEAGNKTVNDEIASLKGELQAANDEIATLKMALAELYNVVYATASPSAAPKKMGMPKMEKKKGVMGRK